MVLALVDVVAWLGAAVLVSAGALKLRRPVPAALFIRRLGLPASPVTVRAPRRGRGRRGRARARRGGAAVLAVAGLLYAAFLASLAAYWLRAGERSVSCGCFGGSAAVALGPRRGPPRRAGRHHRGGADPPGVDDGGARLQSLPEAALLLVLVGLVVVALVGASTGVSAAADPGPPVSRGGPGGAP